MAAKKFQVFKDREKLEIRRLWQLVDFFESDRCLSYKLAGYFGEEIAGPGCGHCSVCIGVLEQYSFPKVRAWAASHLKKGRPH